MAPDTATVPSTTTAVRVATLRPLVEAGRKYMIGDEFTVPAEHAAYLAELGLIQVLDPNAPPPGPKLPAARQRWVEAEQNLSARRKELGAIEAEVREAEGKIGGLEAAANAANTVETIQVARDSLFAAQRTLESLRQLRETRRRHLQEAMQRHAGCLNAVKEIEDRIEQLKKAIPVQQLAIQERRAKHGGLLQAAESYVQASLHPAEARLQELQGELASLGG
jgi:chromosome segregation ATPase